MPWAKTGKTPERPGDRDRRQRAGRAWCHGGVATAEASGDETSQRFHASSSSSSGWELSAGVEITYFSDAQLPRSMQRQRSLQKGMKGSSAFTSLLQIGHRMLCSHDVNQAVRFPFRRVRQLAGQIVVMRLDDAHAPELACVERARAWIGDVAHPVDFR